MSQVELAKSDHKQNRAVLAQGRLEAKEGFRQWKYFQSPRRSLVRHCRKESSVGASECILLGRRCLTSFIQAHDPLVNILPNPRYGVPRCLTSTTPLVDKEARWIATEPCPCISATSNPFEGGRRPQTLSWYQVSYLGLYLTRQGRRSHEPNLQQGVSRKVFGILQSSTRGLSSMGRQD